MLRTFHRWDGLVFIVYVFPSWMVIRIFFPFDGGFSVLISIRLIRDK